MSRILVVDDDRDMRGLVAAYLQGAGHQVLFAEDGLAGAEAAAREPPDLILTDFQMPRMDGFGLFNAVRANARSAKVPVVLVTAHNSREMMQKALAFGIDDFLGKPFTEAELLRVVTDRLARPGAAAPPTVTLAPREPEFFGSVLCCRLWGVERFALALKKEELGELIVKFTAEVSAAAERDQGWLAGGDAHTVFAAFPGSAAEERPHALGAVRTALRIVLAAQRLKPWLAARFSGRDLPELVVAIGVHSGEIEAAPAGTGAAVRGEAAHIASFLADSSVDLHWSVAASRAAAQASGFAFVAGRGAQLRMAGGGTVKAVEVKGLARPAGPAPGPDRAATLIEAAVNRNATLVTFAAALPKAEAASAAAPAPSPAPAAAPAVRQPREPTDGYAVVRKLADNGIIAVYLVAPEHGGPQEVLKTILINDDRNRRKRPHLEKFLAHYAQIATAEHVNLARTTGQGLTATHLFVTQEYCPGGDLRNLIAERMTADAAIKALLRIASGLKVAHQKGFIHGDLKPSNIMIRADGSLAIVDFALARIVEYAVGEEESGVLVRSPEYLSPEMINGQAADAQADIYTLGLLLHEMLTGRRAYDSPDLSRVMMDHLTGPVPQLPPPHERFQPLLDRLMAKKREERFASVPELITFMAHGKLQAA